jgi:hypothetical protein
MKLLLKKAQWTCAFLLLFAYNINAQAPDTSTTQKLIRYILQPLDKSQVPTGFMEEYGAPIIPMKNFNGILNDTNNVDINVWRTLYFQMQTAYCGSGSNPFPTIATVNSLIKQNLNDSLPVPIPILIGNYSSIKSYAFSNNLLSYNSNANQVFDVIGRPESPYQSKNLFAASPTAAWTKSGTVKFVCKPNLVWNNSGKTISQIQIDFGNTLGFQNIGMETPITVSYADTGTKRWTIKISFTDNSVMQCYSQYYVAKAASNNLAARYDRNSFDDIWFIPATGNHPSGRVFIRYSRRNTSFTLRKPLLIIEGYDVSNVAPGLQPDNYSYWDFVTAISDEPGNSYDFNGNLDDVAGYDLLFVDFGDGTADIRQNALLVEDIITTRINANKVLDNRFGNIRQQNVVMGLSMGGLVARYALAEMTKNNVNTETRLVLTHDSPHRGANVPLGLQYLIQMTGQAQVFGTGIRDLFPQYDDAINLLNRPATQQMLLYRSVDANNFVTNTFLDNEYRSMISFGPNDPQPSYRFIATSLGNECAQTVFQPYTQLLNADVDIFIFAVPWLSYRFHTIAEAYALPASGTSKIARFKLSSKFKLFGFITVSKEEYNNTAYASGTQMAVDGVPGALNSFVVNVPNFQIGFPLVHLFPFYATAQVSGNPTNFTFVPTASALDVNPFNSAALADKFVNGTNPTYRSSSETFIAQETIASQGLTNNFHIRFTARNSQWMFNEMENLSNNLNCSGNCSNSYYISGPDQLCTSAVFNIPGLPRGATVTWTQSPSGVVTFTPNTGFPITINRVSSGTVTITATITGACTGNVAINKTIDALAISGPLSVCNNRPSYYSINLPVGASVVWSSSPSGKVSLQPAGPNGIVATPINSPTGSYILTATVAGSCATTSQINFNSAAPSYTCLQIGNGNCLQYIYKCTEQYYAGTILDIPNHPSDVAYWHWTVNGGHFNNGSTSMIVPYVPIQVIPNSSTTACSITISPVSECMIESTNEPFRYVLVNTGQHCYGYYAMSPNPATTEVTISIIENTSKTQTDRSITYINIYDQQGVIRKQKKFGKVKTASMLIGDLADGMYVVEIVSGDYKEQKQLLVKH